MLEQIDNILSKTNFTDLIIEILNRPEDLKNNETIKLLFYIGFRI